MIASFGFASTFYQPMKSLGLRLGFTLEINNSHAETLPVINSLNMNGNTKMVPFIFS